MIVYPSKLPSENKTQLNENLNTKTIKNASRKQNIPGLFKVLLHAQRGTHIPFVRQLMLKNY